MADLRGLLNRRRVVIAASVCTVIAGGSVTYAMAAPGNTARYVTAAVSRGDVQQTLNLTGSVQQVNQRAAKFAVSGTVKSVSVAVGDTVEAGQVLARLDPTALQSAVRDAEASLAQAKATLETDQSTESTSSTTATELVATVAAVPSTTSSRGATPSSNQLQQQVKQAQQDVAADISAAQAAMAVAQVACTSSSPSPTPTPTASATASASASPSASSSPSGTPGGATCLAALQKVQSAQGKTAKDQERLQQLLDQLAKSATAIGSKSSGGTTGVSGAQSSGSTSSSASGSRSATQGSGSSSGTSGGTGTSSGQGASQSTAGRTITDQAAVTSAQNALNRANSNLAAAVLMSPDDGTVASVSFSAGSAAGTSSIIIAATGSATVTVDVPLARIRSVNVGQTVHVTADGSTTPVSGAVQAIGLLPASSTSTTSYPVTVLVPHAPGALATGSRAKVSIVIATHTNVVIVPNSALTTTGTGTGSVSVLVAGVATRKTVTVGAIGASVTEVAEGVAVGDRVVIADRSQALPTNSSNTGRFTGGGGAFVGGGGGFGSGAGGGGFGRPGG
jgi:multidrug efflux pump subunit AcrA (membrane-fusion protein)